MRSSGLVAVLLLIFLGTAQGAQVRETQSVTEVLDVTDKLFSLHHFIGRLAAELDAGIATRAEIRRRLEARVEAIFAEPELSERMRAVRDGSIEHTWSDWFMDLAGVPYTSGAVTFEGADRARVVFRRLTVTFEKVYSPQDVSDVFRRYPPIKNVTEEEVLRRFKAEKFGELVLTVTALKTLDVELSLASGLWKVSSINSSVDSASLLTDFF